MNMLMQSWWFFHKLHYKCSKILSWVKVCKENFYHVLSHEIRWSFCGSVALVSGFGGLVVSKFAGSNLAKAVRFFRRKNPQHAFGGEVKPLVPCRRFVACKRFLNGVEKASFWQYRTHSCSQFHLSLLAALALLGTWRHLVAKVGTSKDGKAMANCP
jgi:hypothetical protein